MDRPQIFLRDILDRYEAEVSSRKRSPSDAYHLRPLRAAFGHKRETELTPSDLAAFRDTRLGQVATSTVRKEMTLLISVLTVANQEWAQSFKLDAFKAIRKPAANRARDRRLTDNEAPRLLWALSDLKSPMVRHVFQFALATGMRRGEVLSLTWNNIDMQNRVAHLPMTKNGEPRRVPLSSSARQVLLDLLEGPQRAPESLPDASKQHVFLITANAVRLAWNRVRKKAGVQDLRFHDLRHEAISRFFELGLSVPEVALISGHKDARMLFRYTHLKAENVAQKLG
jgi:integrase